MTGSRGKAMKWIPGIFAMLVMFSGILGCARVGILPPPGEAPPPVEPATGILLLDNTLGVPLDGVKITTEKSISTSLGDGRFSLPGLTRGKHLLVAEKRFPQGAVRRILGVAKVFVGDTPPEIRIPMRDATDVDAFCLDCHPPYKEVTRADQIPRDLHPSGIVPKKARKPTGRYDGKGRVTCESCHSIHRETGNPHFTLTSFADGRMCQECHGR